MCVFCDLPKDVVFAENEHFIAIADRNPVSRGHSLVVSKRHVVDFFELSAEEVTAMHSLCIEVKEYLAQKYHPDAYNLGMNCGKTAGQSVFHFHLHLIPRYRNDKGTAIRGLREYVKAIL